VNLLVGKNKTKWKVQRVQRNWRHVSH
jgi:hypothetical protein